MTARRTAAKGYLMIGGSSLMFGCVGSLVRLTHMPGGMLLVWRMAMAGVMVALVFVGKRWWREVRQRGVPGKLLLLGALDAAQLLTFIVAVRYMNVAVAVFLSYMSPIYIALLAPRLLKQRTEAIVVVALVLSLAGIAVMLAPGLFGDHLRISTLGVVCGLAAGVLLAAFFLVAKSLRSDVKGATMLISNACLVTVLMLPLGIVQTVSSHYRFVAADFWVALGLAVFGTALGGTIFLQGMRYIRVQHTSIVGLLEPASAPLYAFLILGERPALWTLVGGALILTAAVLVVLFGKSEEGLAGSPEEAIAEAEALP
jgi:drug/metabolite transporter (DMT)-like permease